MCKKSKLDIYIKEIKSDGPIVSIDAECGDMVCSYVISDNLQKIINNNAKKGIETEAIINFKKTVDEYVMDWFIDGDNKICLNFSSEEDNEHRIKEGENAIYGVLKPFSYHTFLFPFLWKDDKKVKTRKDFIKCLAVKDKKNVGNYWELECVNTPEFAKNGFTEKYNQYHYFNPAARNAVYTECEKRFLFDKINKNGINEVVQNYRYNLSQDKAWLKSKKDINNKAKYIIEINEDKKYELSLNGIRLKLFNTGIGILIFETENYEKSEIGDINQINDFGRRIYMPFSSGEEKTCSSCAEKIYITFNDEDIFGASKNKEEKMNEYYLQKPEAFDTTRIALFIKKLLTNGEYSITTDEKEKNNKTFYIEPVIDDRMFVACYCIKPQLANEMKVWENNNYAYINSIKNPEIELDENCNIKKEYSIAKELYKFVYIDGGADPTCQSKNLLEKMLGKKYIYDRWIEWGSLTGITEYSLMTITSSTWDALANNFLTEYIEMIILVLAQRASLLNFERLLSDNSLGKKDIIKIHKSYLEFQSQLLLKEVTPQQQGIELYKMMIDNLFINEQSTEIENQIEDAFAQKTANSESRENKILFTLAIFGIFDMVGKFFEWLNTTEISEVITSSKHFGKLEGILSFFQSPADAFALLCALILIVFIIATLKIFKIITKNK